MLVGGLGHASNARFLLNSFFVSDDGFGFNNFDVAELFLQVVDTDFDVELSATSDDVLTSLFGGNLHKRVGFGEFFQSIDQLGQILGVLGSDGNSDDRGHGVLHGSDVMGIWVVGNGSGLQEVLVNADQTNGVSARNVGDELDGSAHHEDGSLDGLFIEIVFLSRDVVGSHESDFHTGGDGAGEDSSEGKES